MLGRGGKGSASDIRISFQYMPGVRTNQAERRFATFDVISVGGHGPSRGLDAPLAHTVYTMAALERVTPYSWIGGPTARKRYVGLREKCRRPRLGLQFCRVEDGREH